jgi:Predicted membrane protein (DUF2127)
MSQGDTTPSGGTPPVPMRLDGEASTYAPDPGHGWILFATIMLAIVGALNIVYGIAAIGNSTFYVRDVKFVIGSLNLWGWGLLLIGIGQIIVAAGIWRGTEWGRWLGILFASLNIIIQFLVLPAHPLWAVMVFLLDVIIVFGLLTYGGRDRHSLA